MDKNWLIRTKSNHILGPVSKEKVVELYKNGSIKPDDEVCSGNGYWFFIREDDMVERFLLGSELQGFNPISEAKDVITQGGQPTKAPEPSHEDITMVGGLNLADLKKSESVNASTPPIPEPEIPAKPALVKETVSTETKKKNNPDVKLKTPAPKAAAEPIKKQDYLKYLGILGFLILFLLIYFRRTIIQSLFEGEITSVSLISSAVAQEDIPDKKKKLLESSVVLEKVTLRSSVGMNGFRVISGFDIEQIECTDLNNDVYQLAVILYPPEVINEKFMIKLRDCVLKLPESHHLKRWLKWVGGPKSLEAKELAKKNFITTIINSQFNLITDIKVRNEIINVLHEIPENTLPEKLLKSYLYLMIGNITHSDNILKNFMAAPPRVNWEKTGFRSSFYHDIAVAEATQIFSKLSKHPADRRAFELLGLYIQSFYNEESLIQMTSQIDTSDVESKIRLKYISGIAPSFVNYLRLANMGENRRIKEMRNLVKYPLAEQSYWEWAFLDIDPLVSEVMIPELQRLEKEDQLWFIYLLDNEKLADLYSRKSGKSFLPGRRPYLKEGLNHSQSFMLSLYKLIELGDINPDLLNKTIEHLIHD